MPGEKGKELIPQGSAIFAAWSLGFVGMGQINLGLKARIT